MLLAGHTSIQHRPPPLQMDRNGDLDVQGPPNVAALHPGLGYGYPLQMAREWYQCVNCEVLRDCH